MAENPVPPAAPPATQPFSWRSWRNLLKLAYAIAASLFSVWFVSFTPVEGPPLSRYVPKNAAVFLQVRSGYDLAERLQTHPALQEFLNDPDVNALFNPREKLNAALENYKKAPAIVQSLVPPTPAGVFPFVGREVALVALAPGNPNDPQSQTEAPYAETDAKKPPLLVFTRLSGAEGQLARLGATYRQISKRVRFYDLGGDLVAFGFNGARPEVNAKDESQATAAKNAADIRLTFWPSKIHTPHKPLEIDVSPQVEMLQEEGVPNSVLRSLTRPPNAADMLNLSTMPAEVSIDFTFNADGSLSALGQIAGAVLPPLPAGAKPGENSNAFAEAVIPFDPRACFHKYLESAMRLKKNASRLSTGQRRWAERFSNLEDREVDLDRDLWPALGKILSFRIQESPQNLNYTRYGLITGAIPFKGQRDIARFAAGELARERWDYLFDGAVESGVKPPYVRRFRKGDVERYVLRTSQITVPTWAIDATSVTFVSDAGPFALRDGTLPDDLPSPPSLANTNGGDPSYFLRLDGERLAPTAEAGATNYFDAIEEDIGPGEFLAQYPNAPLRIQVIKKLTRLLGKFYLEVKPGAAADAAIKLDWKPGKLSEPESSKEDDATPPPPPVN